MGILLVGSKKTICSSIFVAIVSILAGSFLLGVVRERELNSCNLVQELFQLACQEHLLETKDGHILGLKHILSRSEESEPGMNGNGMPVLLVHGLADSSATFVLSGKENSFAGALVRHGFDVWMLDKRGRTPYRHRELQPDDSAFWDFSIDEMVDHDVPDAVEYVVTKTGQPLAMIAGHSQGGLIATLSLATHPKTADKVRSLVVFGSPIGTWGGGFFIPSIPQAVIEFVHPAVLFGSMRTIAGGFCSTFPSICTHLICFAAGCGSSSNFDAEMAGRALHFYPQEASLKNLQHLVQCDRKGQYHRYDHGKEGNLAKYNQETPPAFNLQGLTTPTALFYGKHDRFLSASGFQDTLKALPKGIVKVANGSLPYGHADFIWGIDAKDVLYPAVLDFLASILEPK